VSMGSRSSVLTRLKLVVEIGVLYLESHIVTVYESGEACGLNEKVNNKLSLCHTELIGDVEDLR
jgi:hypothetical protein